MLILKTLELTNFRSYKHLILEDIDKLGLTLISGGNGSGKSTIRNAIEYLLTDSTSETISLDEFTFNGEGNCILRCVIQKDNDTIEIIKYRDHKKNGNSTVLSVNGVEDNFTETDRRETQKNIFKLLDITRELLPISSIFSQYSQSFTNSKESDRKKIIYDALNLHKYTEYSDKAKAKEKELTSELESKITKVSILESDIEELKYNKKEARDKSERFNIEKECEIDILLKDKIKRVKDYEENKKSSIEYVKKDIKIVINELKLLEIEILFSDKSIETTNEKITKFLYSKKELELEKDKIIEEKNRLLYKQKEIEFQLSQLKTSVCPFLNENCDKLEDIIKDKNEELVPRLNNVKEEIIYIDGEIGKLINDINKISDLEDEINNIINKKKDKEIKRDRLNEKLNELNDKTESILKDKGEGLEEVIKLIDYRIEDVKNKENPYDVLLKDTNKLIESKTERLYKLKNEIKEIQELIMYYSFWKVGYGKSGIPNMKCDGFLNSLELETNKILSTISDRMFVSIDSQSKLKSKAVSEKVSYKVLQPDKNISDFNSFSGGEKQRVVLSDIFAFNKLLGKLNVIILDEVLEMSLDEMGKTDVLRLLRRMMDNIDVILVVSHSNQIKDSFDTVLNINKINGESKCIRS